MRTRKRECLSCGYEWVAPVVMSEHTQNLSGEARIWCPECSSGTVMSHPAEETGGTAASCDCCGKLAKLNHTWSSGIETFACNACMSLEED
jgi:ribosomal protein S27AE